MSAPRSPLPLRTTPRSPDRGGAGRGDLSALQLVDLHEDFTELGRIVLDSQPLRQLLGLVVDLAVACVPGAGEVSVTVLEADTASTPVSSGSIAAALDEHQYQTGSGPCLDAARSGVTVHLQDLSVGGDYPGLGARARRHGVRSILSVGMPFPGRAVGALNVYCCGGPGLDEDAVGLAQGFAGFAAVALANAAFRAETTRVVEQMRQALGSGAVVEQAKGVLMARDGLTADAALAELSKASQDQDRAVREIAAGVVDRTARVP